MEVCSECSENYWGNRQAVRKDRKRTSGGVFVAIDSNLEAVVGAEEGA